MRPLDTNVVSEPLRLAGLDIATADACIAAVAMANGLSVATRDTAPVKAAGVAVIDPWLD